MIAPPLELVTERLLLRAPVAGDAQAIFEEYAADAEVTRYLTWPPHRTKESVARFLDALSERHRAGEEFSWVLVAPPDDRPLGMIAARVSGHKADIGYVLGRRHWSRGYMTEAVSALAEWLLAQPDIFRVWAVCDVHNLGSARVLEKAQFLREGLLRRWIVHPGCDPDPRDCYIYGRVR